MSLEEALISLFTHVDFQKKWSRDPKLFANTKNLYQQHIEHDSVSNQPRLSCFVLPSGN